jgi:nitrogen regulatory protein P-II 1
MFKIDAIVQPGRLEPVRRALMEVGVEGMTVSEVRGHGRQRGHVETYRGREYKVDFLPKARIEMVVRADLKEQVIEVLKQAAQTGHIGDGKIFVEPVLQAIRIRNDDRDELAL